MKTIIITLVLLTGLFGNIKTPAIEIENCSLELIEIKALSIEDSIRLVLNEKNLDSYIVELLVAQSKHESGNYKNNLTKKYNNIFARHYEKADIYALGSGGKAEGHSRFARYKSIKYATLSQYEYLMRKKYTFMWCDTQSFAIELKQRHYYEDSIVNYNNSLSNILNTKEE